MQLKTWTVALVVAMAALSVSNAAQAARFFVDNTLGDVAPEQVVQVSEPKPAQLLFQFQSNGAANARATQFLNSHVTEHVTARGAFSAVSTTPAEGGAIVSITINNIPQENAASQGFVTGLTFGLRGTVVSDYYVATLEYVSGPDATPISIVARHTLYTAVGRADAPPNATQARNADEAVLTIMRQLVQRMLNDLATQLNGVSGEHAAASTADAPAPETTNAEASPAEITPAAEPVN